MEKMSSFIETQKLAKIQSIPTFSVKKKRRGKKRCTKVVTNNHGKEGRNINKTKFLQKVRELPQELLKLIFVQCPDLILVMRAISIRFLERIDTLCLKWCKDMVSFEEELELHTTKLFFNIILFSDIHVSRDKKIILQKCGFIDQCSSCNNNKNSLVIKDGMSYKCAFGCRRYYCSNRSCDLFGIVAIEYDLTRLVCMADGCGKPLKKYYGSSNPERCRQRDAYAKSYEKCYYNDKFAHYACDDCIGYYGCDFDYDYYSYERGDISDNDSGYD